MMRSSTEEKRIEKKEERAREDGSRTVSHELLENGRRRISAERAAELARINREEMGGPA